MNRIEPEAWARLEQSRPSGENLTARLAAADVTDRLQCAIDSDGRRHLLVALKEAEDEFRDAHSRGLSVVTRDLVVPSQPAARYLDIECHDAAGYGAFDLIGGELAEALSHDAGSPAEVVRRVLAKWRRFWGEIPRSLLSRQELFGLFGELWFLLVWLVPRVGVTQAVHYWRGPFGARHDFEWPGKSVEVKATISTRGRIHRIHGVDQLAPPEHGELLLFSLRLREEGGASNTLPALIDQCRSRFESDAEVLGQFELGLVRANYSPVHNDEYEKVSVRIIEEALFAVRDDFPRITARLFVGGMPGGVESLEYEINLSAFDHLCVARSARDGAAFL